MKHKLTFGTASLLAIATATSAAIPARAQGTPEAVNTQPGDQVQPRPTPAADATATAQAPTGDVGEEIVVTGFRQSLRTSAGLKRQAIQIVDAIVAEDIGKLPDRTVSEALARVPGVTVERAVAEAGDIFIRGLPRPATTYNGRDIFTAEARVVAPQDFPAGGVAALEVYKSQTADQIEGNLAGLVNVRSRRPFDFQGLEVAGALNGTYADRSDHFDWNGNLLLSNRWTVGDGEIGVLLNASYVQLKYQDSARFVSGDFFGLNPDPARPGTFVDNLGQNNATTVRIPVGVGLFQSPGFRQRPSANASIQWRPTPELEFYADGLFQGFRREVSDRLLFVPTFGGSAYTNLVRRSDANGYGQSVQVTGPAIPDGFQAGNEEKTDTYQFAAGGVYDGERIKVAFDAARTMSKFDLSIYSVDYVLSRSGPLTVDFDVPRGDGGAEFEIGGIDLTDLNNYLYRGFFDRQLVAKGDDWQFRFDATFKDVAPFIPSIQVGARYNNRDGGFFNGQRYSQLNRGIPYGSLPLQFELTRDGYRGDINRSARRLNLPTFDSIRAAGPQLRTLAGFTQGLPLPGVAEVGGYTVNEKAMTLYSQLNYGFDMGTLRLDGAIGVRYVQTDFQLRSGDFSAVGFDTDPASINVLKNSYRDVLPNISARLRFTDRLQLRAAFTQTRQRPNFGDLNPSVFVAPTGAQPIGRASGGNPFLRPIQSNNYDISLEAYFGQTGLASVALFRRDVKDYIINTTVRVDVPGVGPFDVSGPVNVSSGRLQGLEAQFRTFFDFDFVPEFARGFGVELNYTYIDNELDPPPGAPADAPQIQFPEVSKHSYNLVGFYESGGLTARVAYNYRSRYAETFIFGANNQPFSPEFVQSVTRLDASVSYNITENFTIAADVSNILGKPFRNFREIEPGVVYPRDVRYEERVYSAGVRFRF